MHPQDRQATQTAAVALIAALRSDDKYVRSAAARGLAELDVDPAVAGPALVQALEDADPAVAGNALDALAALGPRVLDRAVPALSNPQRRHLALRLISRLGAQAKVAVPQIAELLSQSATSDADREFQRELRIVLAQMGPDASAAVPALIASLASDIPQIRNSSAYALGKIRAAEAISPLRQLESSDDPQSRMVAVWALLQVTPDDAQLVARAVPMLVNALGSEQELVRLEAANTLGDLGAPARSSLDALRPLLRDESQAVRDAAAAAIAKLEAR
jgi:HEAT repeat protein